MIVKIFVLISAVSFLFYAIRSIFSSRMISEYYRWGFSTFRPVIIVFQILASIGLLIGFYSIFFLLVSSLFLTIMMIIAIIVRIRIQDSFLNTMPAIFYALLNCTIFLAAFNNIYNFF